LADALLPHYRRIVSVSESYLDRFGAASPRGVGWIHDDAETRYRVMLDVIKPGASSVSLLDFGCGLSNLYEYILGQGFSGIEYSGLDLSPRYLALSRLKYPTVRYYDTDVLDPTSPPLGPFDYVAMNGLFHTRGGLSQEEMFTLLRVLVSRLFEVATVGIAFNVISKQVDWEREDLFHLSIDSLLAFLAHEVSRHVVVRHDYGLYEYTVYVYRHAVGPTADEAKPLLNERRATRRFLVGFPPSQPRLL
jgi:SAM-dependent methyltransferase